MEINKNNNNNNLKPIWITGFSDGESSFSVAIIRDKAYKMGIYFIPAYAIELKDKDLDLLYKIQVFFKGVGRIHRIKGKGHAVYVVNSISDLMEVIIPHFTKYPLLTVKRITFLLFKDIVELMYRKRHLTLDGVQSIINIRASMNQGVIKHSIKHLETFYKITPVSLPPLNPLSVNDINVDWLVGFTDAEGCFFINIRLNRKRDGYWVVPSFSLVQHSRDTLLFSLIKEFLQGGFIDNSVKNVIRYRTERLSFILEVIILIFNNNCLQSRKLKDYLSFCSACQLINDKAHLTEEGLIKIKDIKNNMNSKRKD